MKIDLKTLVLLGAIVVLSFFLFDTCKGKEVAEDQAAEYANYKDTAMAYKSKSGKEVIYNKALKMNQDMLLMLTILL